MKKIFICSVLLLAHVCAGSAGAAAHHSKNSNAAPSLEMLIPPALTDTLLAAGVDNSALRPVRLKNGGAGIFVFTSEAENKIIAVLQRPGSKGMLLLADESAASAGAWSMAAFDLSDDTFHLIDAQAVSTDCLREIASTGKSIFFILYDCVLLPEPRYCLSSIIDLFIDLYITGVVCRPESPSGNAASALTFY